MEMTKAFDRFDYILSLDGEINRQHREWLKDYEGMHYSIAENKIHKIQWQKVTILLKITP